MEGDIDNIQKFRKPGDPSPEEVKRIVDDIVRPFAVKHAPATLHPTDAAVQKGKAIHVQIIREAHKEIDPTKAPDMLLWRKRFMEAYRVNFAHHFTKDELVEVLSVMHCEMALEKIR